MERNETLSTRESEVDCDLCLDRDRLSVQKIGPIAPLFHRIDRGWNQHGMSAYSSEALDGPFFGDVDSENYFTLNMSFLCELGISGHNFGKEETL